MNDRWLSHLRAREGRPAEADTSASGWLAGSAADSARASSRSVVAPLVDRATLRVTGPDAPRFLQAQLTNDLAAVSPTLSQLTAYCNPQGRVIASFRIMRDDDGFVVAAPADVVDHLEERLTFFRLRSQVTFERVTERFVWIGLSGPATAAALDACELSLPRADGEVVARNGRAAVRVRDAGAPGEAPSDQAHSGGPTGAEAGGETSDAGGADDATRDAGGPPPVAASGSDAEPVHAGHNTPSRAGTTPLSPPRVELVVPAADAPALWDELRAHADAVTTDAWRYLDVRAGIPWVFSATCEAFVPQMLNLDVLGAVSFTKGCFPGQEIVARLRYRGTLKRRMYRARTDAQTPPAPGETITGSGGAAAGKVVMSAMAPAGGYDLLAVLVIEQASQPDADLHLESGSTLVLKALPYPVDG